MRSRITFVAILLSLFGLLYSYLGLSLFAPLSTPSLRWLGWVLMTVLFGTMLWVPLVFWQSDRDKTTTLERALLWVAYGAMGMLSFVLVFSLARSIALTVPGSPDWLRSGEASGAVLTLSAICFLVGYLRARYGVKLWRVEVPIENLPAAWEGLRIVQITDLHVGPTIRRPDVEKVVAMANSAEPDLIMLTGDLIDGMVNDLRTEVAPLAGLRSKLGVFYAPGNHEYYWEPRPWFAHFAELGMTVLANAHRVLERGGARLVIAGITDPAASHAEGGPMEGPDLEHAIRGAPSDVRPRIFLCHQPRFYPEAEKRGFDLQLSGHTHGGQFFPWTLVAGWVHRFNYGLGKHHGLSVYVSRGTGYWGPPVRLGSPAEVTFLNLRRSVV